MRLLDEHCCEKFIHLEKLASWEWIFVIGLLLVERERGKDDRYLEFSEATTSSDYIALKQW